MKNRILIAWLLVLALALTGCGEGAGTETTGSGWKEAETTGETEDTAMVRFPGAEVDGVSLLRIK